MKKFIKTKVTEAFSKHLYEFSLFFKVFIFVFGIIYIQIFSFFPAKILVSSGSQSASTIKFIEIIDLINPKFVFNMESKDNTDRIGSFGCVLRSQSLKDYFHDQAIICGRGARGSKGGLVMGNLKNTLKLFEPRYYASGVVLSNTTLWITGGRNG